MERAIPLGSANSVQNREHPGAWRDRRARPASRRRGRPLALDASERGAGPVTIGLEPDDTIPQYVVDLGLRCLRIQAAVLPMQYFMKSHGISEIFRDAMSWEHQ